MKHNYLIIVPLLSSLSVFAFDYHLGGVNGSSRFHLTAAPGVNTIAVVMPPQEPQELWYRFKIEGAKYARTQRLQGSISSFNAVTRVSAGKEHLVKMTRKRSQLNEIYTLIINNKSNDPEDFFLLLKVSNDCTITQIDIRPNVANKQAEQPDLDVPAAAEMPNIDEIEIVDAFRHEEEVLTQRLQQILFNIENLTNNQVVQLLMNIDNAIKDLLQRADLALVEYSGRIVFNKKNLEILSATVNAHIEKLIEEEHLKTKNQQALFEKKTAIFDAYKAELDALEKRVFVIFENTDQLEYFDLLQLISQAEESVHSLEKKITKVELDDNGYDLTIELHKRTNALLYQLQRNKERTLKELAEAERARVAAEEAAEAERARVAAEEAAEAERVRVGQAPPPPPPMPSNPSDRRENVVRMNKDSEVDKLRTRLGSDNNRANLLGQINSLRQADDSESGVGILNNARKVREAGQPIDYASQTKERLELQREARERQKRLEEVKAQEELARRQLQRQDSLRSLIDAKRAQQKQFSGNTREDMLAQIRQKGQNKQHQDPIITKAREFAEKLIRIAIDGEDADMVIEDSGVLARIKRRGQAIDTDEILEFIENSVNSDAEVQNLLYYSVNGDILAVEEIHRAVQKRFDLQ